MISKVLIANRGEIAVRIIRTAKIMGYSVVAVFSEQDREAAHVKQSDESVFLPGNNLSDTYLNISAIIEAAKKTNAQAIHPGYGFLSENPLFAEACENEGIVFIGPSSSAIRAMGNKIAAREIAVKHGVPIAPGITGSPQELIKEYKKLGFPLLIKAAAGGGGKGMRIVRSENDMEAALKSTSSEAANYFGDSTIYIERFFDGPRHIEVQILGDKQGNVIHLYERECSMQRRHQKIIEEAPSPSLTPEIREKICQSAVTLAKSIGYYSAGTIEFLVDNELNYYFLEMNTRIQVEHPVTEFITGIDIVQEQFNIAEGNALSFRQKDLSINGHSIEVRVYAEDPFNNFMPSPGLIRKYSYPLSSDTWNNIRVDEPNLQDNSVIYSNFDPMISKVIAHGTNREDAISKLTGFLPSYAIMGIKTNLSFLYTLLKYPDYLNNRIHTRYIDNHLSDIQSFHHEIKSKIDTAIPFSAGLTASFGIHNAGAEVENIWEKIGYWRIFKKLSALIDDRQFDIILEEYTGNQSIYYILDSSGERRKYTTGLLQNNSGGYILSVNGNDYSVYLTGEANSLIVKYNCFDFTFRRLDLANPDNGTLHPVSVNSTDTEDIISPMPGRVLSVTVKEGIKVTKGELLMVIEAMKMENNILAPYDGTVDRILVKEGSSVDTSSHLVHLSKTVQE